MVNSAGQPVVASTLITSAAFNAFTAEVATALSTAIYKDGQQTVTANTPWGGFRITNVGITGIAGTVGTPAINLSDAATGFYRTGANAIGLSINGTNLSTWSGTSWALAGVGPHAIGGTTNADIQLALRGTFTGGGDSKGLYLDHTLVVPANGVGVSVQLAPTINKAGAGTHADFISLRVDAPNIGAGAAALTNVSALKVTGSGSGGTNGYGIWNVGNQRQDGTLFGGTTLTLAALTGNNLLFGRVASVVPGSFTEDMRLSAGILLVGTTVTTGASAGSAVFAYGNNAVRAVVTAGNNTVNLVNLSTINAITNTLQLGDGNVTEISFGHANRTAAAVPANFTADYYLKFRDSAGNLFYIPGRNATW